jgi:enamine deaminase RidA (YjgF/YER057c/UK114 family)
MNTPVLPAGWKRPRGYANGVSARGREVHVAGMIGWDETETFQTDDFAGQVRQALANIVAVLHAADALPKHIVRMTWYVVDRHEYRAALPAIGAAFRDVIGHYDIAMTAVQVMALIEDRAKVEIEVTAIVPDPETDTSPGGAAR